MNFSIPNREAEVMLVTSGVTTFLTQPTRTWYNIAQTTGDPLWTVMKTTSFRRAFNGLGRNLLMVPVYSTLPYCNSFVLSLEEGPLSHSERTARLTIPSVVMGFFSAHLQATIIRRNHFSHLGKEVPEFRLRHSFRAWPILLFRDTGMAISWFGIEECLLAGITMSVFSFAIQPLDAVRNRMLIDLRYRSIPHTFRTIFAEEGMKAFYRGWQFRFTSGITCYFYHYFNK